MILDFKFQIKYMILLLEVLFNYCEILFVYIFWMLNEFYLKWQEYINSIFVRRNGVKGRKFLLLLIRMSCFFLIYQLIFYVQNLCIFNSFYKMLVCLGIVGCWNVVFSSMDGGFVQVYCSQCFSEILQLFFLNMCR